jgi:hypothetical protein
MMALLAGFGLFAFQGVCDFVYGFTGGVFGFADSVLHPAFDLIDHAFGRQRFVSDGVADTLFDLADGFFGCTNDAIFVHVASPWIQNLQASQPDPSLAAAARLSGLVEMAIWPA